MSQADPCPLVWYSCHICRLCFANIQRLSAHCTKVHGKFSTKWHHNRVFLKTLEIKLKRNPEIEIKVENAGSSNLEELDIASRSPSPNQNDDDTKSEPLCNYNCKKCNQKFRYRGNYQRHLKLRICTEPPSYPCKMCSKVFQTSEHLMTHTRVHTQERPFHCYMCSLSFKQNETLYSHLRSKHTMEKPFRCKFCSKAFTCGYPLKIHLRSHTGKQLQKCNDCSKSFLTNQALELHQRTHSDVRLYKCTLCGHGFNQPQHLKVHMNVHRERVLPYKCKICLESFEFEKRLQKHMKEVHPGDKLYFCSYPSCNAGFNLSHQLKMHIRYHTGDLFKCQFCPKTTNRKSHLRDHEKIHFKPTVFKCKECNYEARSNVGLGSHMRTHKYKDRYPCDQCEVSFSGVKALRRHVKQIHDNLVKSRRIKAICNRNGRGQRVIKLTNPIMENIKSLQVLEAESNEMIDETLDSLLTPKIEIDDPPNSASTLEIDNSTHPPDMNFWELPEINLEGNTPECDIKIPPLDLPQFPSKESIIKKRLRIRPQSITADSLLLINPPLSSSFPSTSRSRFGRKVRKLKYKSKLSKPKSKWNLYLNTIFTKSSSNEYLCSKCGKTLKSSYGALCHMEKYCPQSVFKKTKPPGIKCQICQNIIPSKRLLHLHKLNEHSHFDLRPHECSICNNRFSKKSILNSHIRQVHNQSEETFDCQFCGKKFSTKLRLDRHELIHTNPDRFKCSFCPKGFPRRDQLQSHIRTHTGDRQYACTLCSKTFLTGPTLKYHMVSHTGEKQFKCTWPDCSSEFRNLTSLRIHKNQVHLGEKFVKSFICEICGKAFPYGSYLKFHKKTHLGLKPYMCSICGFQCSQKTNLNTHMNAVHSDGVLKFECLEPTCSKRFTTKLGMRAHFRRHSIPNSFKCMFCDYKCQVKQALFIHLAKHTLEKPYKCDFDGCGKSFGFSQTLRGHGKLHRGEKDHKCEYCGMAFYQLVNLQKHVTVCHTGDLFFKCRKCQAPFKTGRQVEMHITKHHSK